MSDSISCSAGVVACTIVARNYLPAARVLAESYLQHHPDHQFVIAIIDVESAAEVEVTDRDRLRAIGWRSFGIPEADYLRMATAYTVTELATAVKPYLLQQLRAGSSLDAVVMYLDPDIQVFHPMPELATLARAHQLVLTPHFRSPLPRDGKEPGEAVIMGAGIFNLGFIATGPGSEPFLEFWSQRLRQDAIVAPDQQLFTDQRWVDQVPALFTHHVLRDPGFNVAYWNLHERALSTAADGSLRAGGEPLRFVHFSGYRPESPWLLSLYCRNKPRVLLSEQPVLRQLCDSYGEALCQAGYGESIDTVPYGFARLDDGEPLLPGTRRLFREGWIEAEREGTTLPPAAFGDDGSAAFRQWATTPAEVAQAAAGLHRLALAVWQSRLDLQLTFPNPCGADATEFRQWCHRSAVTEKMLPTWALPVDPEPPADPEETFGVNIAGYLTAELGLGEMGRIVYDTIIQAGIDAVSIVEERSVNNRMAIEHAGVSGDPCFPISLLAINADQTPLIVSQHPELTHNRYTIGLWAWELEDFPDWQHKAFDLVDEVWTISEFCRRSIAAHSPVPVKAIPVPVRDPGPPPPRARKAGEDVRFLFAFDFNSTGGRKNPWGVITAFQKAFADRTDVRLTLKAINGKHHIRSAERLRMLVAADDRIELIERYLSTAELDNLYRDCDCYVSLHRSEGFGLTVAEAMIRALPVISTDYSGTAEFLDSNTGWPIPYYLVPVGEGNIPYHEEAIWAEPDLAAAAAAMREVADDPAEAERRGAAAREHILRTRPMSATTAWMRTELTRVYDTWRQRNAPQAEPAPPAPVDPLRPLQEGKNALQWRPDPAAPSRLPLAPAMRKLVTRAVDHYDVHQRSVMGALLASVEESAARLLSRIETLEAGAKRPGIEALREEFGSARERLEQRMQDLESQVRTLRLEHGRTQHSVRSLQDHNEHTERAFADVRDDIAALSADLGEVSARAADQSEAAAAHRKLAELEQHTHAEFHERDKRADADRVILARLDNESSALRNVARVVHAPVPDGLDVVLCDAGALLLPVDNVVWPWIELHRSWEKDEAEHMAELMARRPGAFIDVGAHVGYHTLRIMQSCPAVPLCVAVEVDPVNFSCLERNVAVNLPADLSQRVTCLHSAAWDEDGSVRLVHNDAANSGDIRVRRATPTAANEAGSEVPAVRLDTVPELSRHPVTLIKLDLQGRDQRAIAGLSEVIHRDQPDIVCEFSPADIAEFGDDPAQVLTGYRKLGYQLGVIGSDTHEMPDADLIRHAQATESGFLTLWLHQS